MTKSELDSSRKRVPLYVFTVGLSLYFIVTAKDLELAKLKNEIIVPFIAAIATYFYVGLGIRKYLWKREMEAHLGKQIRAELLKMIPADLGVSAEEEAKLGEQEIYKELTGVFWEAIDRDEELKAHKEHFYSEGIIYSTSIDIFVIGLVLAVVYLVASLLTERPPVMYLAVAIGVIALLSRILVTPSSRRRHLRLSEEQLDKLRRNQSDFVSKRFRDIVRGWRAQQQVIIS